MVEEALAKERTHKAQAQQIRGTRHSFFGGTFVVKNQKSISGGERVYHKPLAGKPCLLKCRGGGGGGGGGGREREGSGGDKLVEELVFILYWSSERHSELSSPRKECK